MNKQLSTLKAQKKPLKFLLAYALWRSGLCKLFTFKVNGVRFRFFKSNLSMHLFINPNYIKDDLDYLKEYLKPGDNFIDVGANIGTWANLGANAVGPNGKVICFEPHPLIFTYLSGNIELNNFGNIEAHNVGCADKEGKLFFSQNFDSMNHVTFDPVNSITIPVKDLDSYTQSFNVINLIKIDVEGFELNVLKGADKTLEKTKVVIFESNGTFQKKYGYQTGDILTLLMNKGFKVFKIVNDNDYLELASSYESLDGEDLIAIK